MPNENSWDSMTPQEALVNILGVGFLRVKIGKYTGDAAASKAISGVGFKPKFLLIYEMVTNKNIILKSDQDGTKSFVQPNGGANLYVDDQVISLDSDGFTVGDGTGSVNHTNEAQDYVYVAFG